MSLFGWLGSIMLALCALPQAIQCIREGHSRGLNGGFLALWTLGELFTFIAVLADAPVLYLIFNYGANLILLSVICFYKIRPRVSNEERSQPG